MLLLVVLLLALLALPLLLALLHRRRLHGCGNLRSLTCGCT